MPALNMRVAVRNRGTFGGSIALADPAAELPACALALGATVVDYLVPMAAEMPDIDVAHVETPTSASLLGAKGVGESGTGAAPAVVMNAVNDALRPFGVRVTTQPITPEVILTALAKI